MSNIASIKKKIFLVKAFDWFLMFLVFGVALPCIFLTEYKITAGICMMVGLGIIGQFSAYSLHKIAALKAELNKLERQAKEAQRQRRRR